VRISGLVAAHPVSKMTAKDSQYKPEIGRPADNAHVVLFRTTDATSLPGIVIWTISVNPAGGNRY
jgi:hypothetical protein